jgi:hypothetical protein
MEIINIRVDKEFRNLLRERAEKREIKLSRYVRSLIEKGMVVESQLEQSSAGVNSEKKKNINLRMAEMIAENLILTRTVIESNSPNKTEADKIIADAENRAHSYIEDLVSTKE